MLQDRVAIAGIGATPFAKRLAQSELRLALDAILAALDDAGIAPGEVDGLASYPLESSDEVEVAKCLGLGDVTFFTQVGWGGGAGGVGCPGASTVAGTGRAVGSSCTSSGSGSGSATA